MSFLQCHFRSDVLGKQVQCHVILPDVGTPPFPVYYLLHGLSDDHTIWGRRTRIESYVERVPMIVVMPDGFRGFYTDQEEGPAYARYFVQDLFGFVERNLPARTKGKARCIGGLSMGGYGAMRLALAHPNLFTSCNSHSGALMRGSMVYGKPEQAEMRRVFGRRPAGSNHDLVALATKAVAHHHRLPSIRIDCGTEDFLLDENRRFSESLAELGVRHEYAEYAGGHTWDYWDLHVREAIEFHSRALKIRTL